MKKWTQFTIHPQTLLSGVLTQMSHGKKEQSSESLHTDFHQYLVCPPCARTTDSRRLLIPWMSLRIWFWGILFHSSCRAAVNSLRLWTGGSLCLTRRPRKSHKCSMGLRSGLMAGHGILSIAFCRKKSFTACALWGLALSSINMGLVARGWFSKWGTTALSRTSCW